MTDADALLIAWHEAFAAHGVVLDEFVWDDGRRIPRTIRWHVDWRRYHVEESGDRLWRHVEGPGEVSTVAIPIINGFINGYNTLEPVLRDPRRVVADLVTR